jgi:hypothetical protein
MLNNNLSKIITKKLKNSNQAHMHKTSLSKAQISPKKMLKRDFMVPCHNLVVKNTKKELRQNKNSWLLGENTKKNMKVLLKREFIDRAPSCNLLAWNTKRARFFQSFHVLAMHTRFNMTKPI